MLLTLRRKEGERKGEERKERRKLGRKEGRKHGRRKHPLMTDFPIYSPISANCIQKPAKCYGFKVNLMILGYLPHEIYRFKEVFFNHW